MCLLRRFPLLTPSRVNPSGRLFVPISDYVRSMCIYANLTPLQFLHSTSTCNNMEANQQPEWSFDNSTQDVFDDLWTLDLGTFDFQSAIDDSYGISGLDDSINKNLTAFDELVTDNLTPDEFTAPSQNLDTLDTFALDQLILNNRPNPPRQRALPRRRSKYVLRRSGSHTTPVAIPTSSLNASPVHSLAIERWQNSPPEEEAASLSAIYNAMEQRPFNGSSRGSRTPSYDAFKTYRGPSSSTSLDSGVSDNSVHSNQSGTSQSRRRRAAKPRNAAKSKAKPKDTADRIFKCTFCCDTFKHKYDWARHEKSLHLNMEEWICTPHGGSVVLALTGRVHCAYCSALDPTQAHLEGHNFKACQGQTTARTFRRKDHLVQHLRLVHGLDTLPLIDDWKLESAPVTSRCGFCDAQLGSWDVRTDHVAAHFRSGKTMADWKGDHGFDPDINARVSNAFPPYLIAAQAETLVPFSATNHESIDHTKQVISHMQLELLTSATQDHHIGPNVSPIADQQPSDGLTANGNFSPQQGVETRLFADILTRHLARFARQQMMLGVMPTDEMFQRESRRVLYQDADDEWNQTVADNPEWIRQFRERTGFS
jgi:hypothetical protein